MDELQEILSDVNKQNEIKQAAVYNQGLALYTYKKTGKFQVSGKTREKLLINLIKIIKDILRSA